MSLRTCVFCGKAPTSKNKEHVIPQWLIALTGDPGRAVPLGLKKDPTGFEQRKFAFSAFTFPACGTCNDEFSHLESRVKTIVEGLLNAHTILGAAVPDLLDWLDKVRVGLWLGHRLLDKNVYGIEPHFHIKQRLAYHDRAVALYRIDTPDPNLTFSATDLPIFAHTPSCFALRINSMALVNISYDFFLSRRLGLPYPRRSRLRPNGATEYEMNPGTRRVALPLLHPPLPLEPLEFFQPIRPPGFENMDELYVNEHADRLGLTPPATLGRILTISAGNLGEVGLDTMYPLPTAVHRSAFAGPVARAVLDWQLTLYARMPSLELLQQADQKRIRTRALAIRRLQTRMMRSAGAV
jgi:hypothetical protein